LGRGAILTHGCVVQGFKSQVVAHGATAGIDVQVVERNPADRGFVPQSRRWVVEQTFGVLSLHRRLVRDYEHRLSSSASRVYWAMTDVMAPAADRHVRAIMAAGVTAASDQDA
jgi:hypothetical protein